MELAATTAETPGEISARVATRPSTRVGVDQLRRTAKSASRPLVCICVGESTVHGRSPATGSASKPTGVGFTNGVVYHELSWRSDL